MTGGMDIDAIFGIFKLYSGAWHPGTSRVCLSTAGAEAVAVRCSCADLRPECTVPCRPVLGRCDQVSHGGARPGQVAVLPRGEGVARAIQHAVQEL